MHQVREYNGGGLGASEELVQHLGRNDAALLLKWDRGFSNSGCQLVVDDGFRGVLLLGLGRFCSCLAHIEAPVFDLVACLIDGLGEDIYTELT